MRLSLTRSGTPPASGQVPRCCLSVASLRLMLQMSNLDQPLSTPLTVSDFTSACFLSLSAPIPSSSSSHFFVRSLATCPPLSLPPDGSPPHPIHVTSSHHHHQHHHSISPSPSLPPQPRQSIANLESLAPVFCASLRTGSPHIGASQFSSAHPFVVATYALCNSHCLIPRLLISHPLHFIARKINKSSAIVDP